MLMQCGSTNTHCLDHCQNSLQDCNQLFCLQLGQQKQQEATLLSREPPGELTQDAGGERKKERRNEERHKADPEAIGGSIRPQESNLGPLRQGLSLSTQGACSTR